MNAVPGRRTRYLDAEAPFLVIIGVSASGKSAVTRRLHRDGVIHLTPSWTTRPRRSDERTGSPEHRFVTEREFDALIQAGFFLEVAELFELPYRYGLPRIEESSSGAVPAIMLRAELVAQLRRHYSHPVIYQIDVPDEVMAERLSERDDARRGMRLEGAPAERHLGDSVATRVFLNASTVDELVDGVRAAIARDFAEVSERGGRAGPPPGTEY